MENYDHLLFYLLKEILQMYLFCKETNEDYLYRELQENKNLSKNVLEFMKNKK